MDCRKIREILGFYLDGELGESEAALVEEHIAGCAECRAELESTSCLIDAAGALEEVEPPAYLRAAIAKATTQSRTREAGFGAWVGGLIAPARMRWAAGAAAAVVLGFALIMNSSHAPDTSRQSAARRTAVGTSAPIAAKIAPSENNATRTASIAPAVEKPVNDRIAADPAVRHRHRRAITTASSHKHKAPMKVALKLAGHAKPAASLEPVDTSVNETIDVAETELERSEPEVKPVAETPPDALSEIRPKLVRVASAPLVSPEEAEESIKQIKATAAMRRANGGSLTIISTRF